MNIQPLVKQHHNPLQPGKTKPSFKLLFGHAPVYEHDVNIRLFDAAPNKNDLHRSLADPSVFITPTHQLSDLLSTGEPSNKSLIQFLLASLKKNPLQVLKNEFNNLLSTFKGSPLNKAQGNAFALKVSDAFKRALQEIPNDKKGLTVVLPHVAPSITSSFSETDMINAKAAMVRNLAEQSILQAYNPYLYRQKGTTHNTLQSILLQNAPITYSVHEALAEGKAIGKGMNLTRYLVDAPPNVKNPRWISQKALELAEHYPNVKVSVHDRDWIQEQKMGLFLSVASGNQKTNQDSPRLVEMVYTPPDGHYSKTIMLVGKGIIFDTGGTNLKTGGDPKTGRLYIHGMHGDMAGAAAVIGAIKTIADMKLPNVRVVALTPLTPNRIGENATLPHSVFTARNGKTVEISNTDAEGRLVLADAMHYGGEKYNPDLIVDIATLTGGKVGALGAENSVAVMGNRFDITRAVTKLERQIGRKAAAVKLTQGHHQWVTKAGKGKADVYNSVNMQSGEKYNLYGQGTKFEREKHIIHHSAQGGAFLKEFLHNPNTPWVHLDIAGSEFEPVPRMGNEEYATGIGVKELYLLTKEVAEGKFRLN